MPPTTQTQARPAGRAAAESPGPEADPFAQLSLPPPPNDPRCGERQEAAALGWIERAVHCHGVLTERAAALPRGSTARQQADARLQLLEAHLEALLERPIPAPERNERLSAAALLIRQADETLGRAEDGSFTYHDKRLQRAANAALERETHLLGVARRMQEVRDEGGGPVRQLFAAVAADFSSLNPWGGGIALPSPFANGIDAEAHVDRRRAAFERRLAAIGRADPVVRCTYEGDTAVGTVVHLGQIHPTTERMSPQDRRAVVSVQAAALGHMTENRPEFVFAEGMTTPLREKASYPEYERRVRSAFPEGRLGDPPTEAQASCLFDLGAAIVYGCLNPEAQVRGTTTAAFDERVIGEARRHPDRYRALIMDGREANSMTYVARTLREHPGATAYIVYGAAHGFGPEDFPEGSAVPRMLRVDWPGLKLASPSVATLTLHEMRDYPDLQARLIDRAPHFLPLARSLVDEPLRGRLDRSGKVTAEPGARRE